MKKYIKIPIKKIEKLLLEHLMNQDSINILNEEVLPKSIEYLSIEDIEYPFSQNDSIIVTEGAISISQKEGSSKNKIFSFRQMFRDLEDGWILEGEIVFKTIQNLDDL